MNDLPRNFDAAVWQYVCQDAKSGAKSAVRWILESLFTVPPTLYFLFRHGSADAPKDYSLERLLAVPLGLFVLILVHLSWSWWRAPRKIFYEQQSTIEQQHEEIAGKKSANEQRLKDYTEIIAVGSIQLNRVVKNDSELTRWTNEIDIWERAAFDAIKKDFGESEAHIATQPACPIAVFSGSWGEGHNSARIKLSAMLDSLKALRERLLQ